MASLINSNGQVVLVGSVDADTLDATSPATDSTLYGLAGNDLYLVDSSNDIVVEEVGAGTDTVKSSVSYTLSLNAENLILTGSGNIDATGNELNNALSGNEGDNTLDGGLGNDSMAGGLGNDTYIVDSTADVVTEALNAGLDIVRASVSYTLSTNVEQLVLTATGNINGTGNALDNNISGNTGDNILSGGDGNDKLYGGDGNDTLLGGAGNDYLEGGLGIDGYNGGAGNDYYFVGAGDKPIVEAAGGGDDTVDSDVDWTLEANVENLILRAGSGALNGTGNALNNHLLGNANDNTLTGLAGNDTLDGGSGADTMIGGQGSDTYMVDNTGDKVIELPGAAEGSADKVIASLAFYRLPDNVENLQLTGSGNSVGYGNELDNTLVGNAGNNYLLGFGGNDILNGGAGADNMQGGQGNDTYTFDNVGDFAQELLNQGSDTIISSVTVDLGTMFNVENVTLTGVANLSVSGNSLNNVINGNAGHNFIDGGSGLDTMAGGLGDDTYVVAKTDTQIDNVVEQLNAGYDTVIAYQIYTLPANVEKLVLGDTAGNIGGSGNALDNLLVGNPGNNALIGGAGNDTLDGGAGNDNMQGGLGNDVYYVDSAFDSVTELAGQGTDTVLSSVTFDLNASGANVENLTLTGSGNIDGTGNALNNAITGNDGNNHLIGNTGNDTLTGGAGNDTLDGGAGDDLLDGGLGADAMTGGLGNDTYIVDDAGDSITENASEGTDTVKTSLSFDLSVSGANVENLTLTGSGNIDATGNALNNILIGNDGNNTLDGGAGNDVMRGGKGDDTYVLDSSSDVVTELPNEGLDSVEVRYSTAVTYAVPANVEEVLLADGTGPAAADVAFNVVGNALGNDLEGNSANNTLDGGLGNDILMGGDGDDTLIGGAGNDILDVGNGLFPGNDTMSGGPGDDFYRTDSPGDTIVELPDSGFDRIDSAVSIDLRISAPNVEVLYLDSDGGSINGVGNALDNIIYGGGFDNGTGIPFNNVMEGAGGDDTFYDMAYDTDFSSWAWFDPGNAIDHTTGPTLDSGDRIEGGTAAGGDAGTNDRLFADVVDLSGATGALHVHGVEHITLYSASAGGVGSNTIDATDITGASDIAVADRNFDSYLLADMTIDNLATGVSITAADFHNALSLSLATDTGNDTQNITVHAFSGALTTTAIETVNLTVLEPTDGAATDVDMSAASGVQHLVLSGPSGVLNLHMPTGADLSFQDLSLRLVHILDNALGSLSLKLDDSATQLQTDSSFATLSLNTTGSGASVLDASASGAAAVNVTGNQALDLTVDNQNVDAHALTAGLFADAQSSNATVSLLGGSGNDNLNGGSGADRLNGGGTGVDQLTGNGGADTFVFNHAPTGTDVSLITDFATGVDQIELNHTAFSDLSWSGSPHTLAAGEFFQGEPTGISGQHIIFDPNSGNLYYDQDGAAGGAKLFANLGEGGDVHNTDIQVV